MHLSHSFAVCAYGESPFLEDCVKSCLEQTKPSKVFVATSTPNAAIERVCSKYDLSLFVNELSKGISFDWNYACSCADTKYVTIAHQDDIYFKDYSSVLVSAMESSCNGLIGFSDYCEIRGKTRSISERNLKIKRLMLWPLKFNIFQKSVFMRRMILSFGCPICCPSVVLNKTDIGENLFLNRFKGNLDWDAWERVSRTKGSFVFSDKVLMGHRIHNDSETAFLIQNNTRSEEDYVMFRNFWPERLARLLSDLYMQCEESSIIKP